MENISIKEGIDKLESDFAGIINSMGVVNESMKSKFKEISLVIKSIEKYSETYNELVEFEYEQLINKIIGQLGKGVLIKDKFSLGVNGLRTIRHQYTLDLDTFIEGITDEKTGSFRTDGVAEVVSKLGNEKGKLFFDLLEKYNQLESLRKNYTTQKVMRGGYRSYPSDEDIPIRKEVNPKVFIRHNDNELLAYHISGFQLRRGTFEFVEKKKQKISDDDDDNYETYRLSFTKFEDSESYDENWELQAVAYYHNEIIEFINEKSALIIEQFKEKTKIVDEIKTLGAKYLVLASLQGD